MTHSVTVGSKMEIILEDERKKAILNFIHQNPGTSLRNLITNLNKVAAPATITKKISELDHEGFLRVERGRKGQKTSHYITEKGERIVKLLPQMRMRRGIIQFSFSEAFLENMGREYVDRFLALLNDPIEEKKIADLISGQIALYILSFKKPSWSIKYIEGLKRYFYAGALPEADSDLIRRSIKMKNFGDENEAFDFILVRAGLRVFKSFLRGGGKKDPKRLFVKLIATKYDTRKGYVSASKEFKEWLQKIPPKQLKDFMLRVVKY